MNISININYLAKSMGMGKAAQIIAQAGFRSIDYTPPVIQEDWESVMLSDIKLFEKWGLSVHQTHAPFNRYNTYGDQFMECLERAFLASMQMNASYMVVHGDEFDFQAREYTPQNVLNHNYELYAPFMERACASSLKIAFENLFEEPGNNPRFCSNTTDLKAMIQRFSSDSVCCCWDFGHANVAFGEEQADKIKEMGSLIECTHVHDNKGLDWHMIPFTGGIDWKACMKGMDSFQYQGNLSFELVYGTIPQDLADSFAAFLYQIGESLIALSRS